MAISKAGPQFGVDALQERKGLLVGVEIRSMANEKSLI